MGRVLQRFLLLILVIIPGIAPGHAQHKDSEVYTVVDTMPEFPGGMQGLNKYFTANFRYPDKEDEEIIGHLRAGFIVTANGKIKDVVLTGGKGSKVGEEFVRLIAAMPDWEPAMLKGKPVNCKYAVSLHIRPQE